jgi:hypothetical protein
LQRPSRHQQTIGRIHPRRSSARANGGGLSRGTQRKGAKMQRREATREQNQNPPMLFSSPYDEGVGRGSRRGALLKIPPLPGPLLHFVEERECWLPIWVLASLR